MYLLGHLLREQFFHCVNAHLNATEQQTAKTFALIVGVTLSDDQIIKYIWLALDIDWYSAFLMH